MSTSSRVQKNFELESLEPRLLLSGDGLMGAAAADILDNPQDTIDAIVVQDYAELSAIEDSGNDLFEMEDEAITVLDSGADSTEAEADPTTEATATAAESDDEAALSSAEMTALEAVEDVLDGTAETSLEATSVSGQTDPLSEELVTTLNAANGPPSAGNAYVQQVSADSVISGSVDSDGSGLVVSISDEAETVVVSPEETISGNTTIDGNVLNRGTLSPGNSPGTLTINGNLTLTNADPDQIDDSYAAVGTDTVGTIVIDIDNVGVAGTDYDVINVVGDLTLAGLLEVVVSDSYEATLGDSFDIITYTGTLSGEFFEASGIYGWGTGEYFLEVSVDEVNKIVSLVVTESGAGGSTLSGVTAINDILGMFYSDYFDTLPALLDDITGDLGIDEFVDIQGTFDFTSTTLTDLTIGSGVPPELVSAVDSLLPAELDFNSPNLTGIDMKAMIITGSGVNAFVGLNGPYWIEDLDADGRISWSTPTGVSVTNPDGTAKATVTEDGEEYGDLNGNGIVDANESAELSEDALGLAVTDLDFALIILKLDKFQNPLDISAGEAILLAAHRNINLKSFKATASDFRFIGWDEIEISAQEIEIAINNGSPWPNGPPGVGPATMNYAASFETSLGAADGSYDVLTDGDTISFDFAGAHQEFGAERITVRLSQFVHLTGSFNFEKGPSQIVDVATGISTDALELADTLLETATGLPDNTDFFQNNGGRIDDVRMATMQIGASDVHAFIGIGGPYWEGDTDNDGNIDNEQPTEDLDEDGNFGEDEVNEDALGLVVTDLDFGMVTMAPSLGAFAQAIGLVSEENAKKIIPKFTAIKATARTFEFVGWDEIELSAEEIQINYNNGTPWFEALGPPVVDFQASYPVEGGLAIDTGGDPVLIDFDGNQRIGFSSDKITLRLSEFVYLTGGFFFEMGPTETIDIATGLPSDGLQILDGLLETATGLPSNTNFFENNGTYLEDIEVGTMQIGASNVDAFIGIGGPYQNGDLDDSGGTNWVISTGDGTNASRTLTEGSLTFEGLTYTAGTGTNVLPADKFIPLGQDEVVKVNGIEYGDANLDDEVDADETDELNQDAVGLFVEDLDLGVVMMEPTIAGFAELLNLDEDALNGIIPKFTALKATAETFEFVGWDQLEVSAKSIEIVYQNGTEWLGGLGPPVVDFAKSFETASGLGDGAYAVKTSTTPPEEGGSDPVLIDFDGNQRIGFSSSKMTLKLLDFIHLTGSFNFEQGPVTNVDIATGLPGNLLSTFESALNAIDPIGSAGTDFINNYGNVIPDVEVGTFQIGAANVSAFVGLDGPYRVGDLDNSTDTTWVIATGDGDAASRTISEGSVTFDGVTYSAGGNAVLPAEKFIPLGNDQILTVGGKRYGDFSEDDVVDADESDELNENAVGLIVDNLDLGLVTMQPTIGSLATAFGVPEDSLKGIIPNFTALKATADQVGLVGIDDLILNAKGITINYNNGDAWFGSLGPPVVDFSNTSAFADEQLSLFDTSGDGVISVGELRDLDNKQSFSGLYTAQTAADEPVNIDTIIEVLDTDNGGNGLLEVSEAAVLAGTTNAETADADGDGKIDPLGYEVKTGNDTNPIYINYDGNQRIGAVVERANLQISEFVHVTGSIAFEYGPVETVSLTGGLFSGVAGDLGSFLESLGFSSTLVNSLPGVNSTSKSLAFMTVGASDVQAFIGIGGPYFNNDLNNDGRIDWAFDVGNGDATSRTIASGSVEFDGTTYSATGANTVLPAGAVIVLDKDQVVEVGDTTYGDVNEDDVVDLEETQELNADATGLVVQNFDFGMALMSGTDLFDISKYFALKATAEKIGLVGLEGVTLEARSLSVEINQSTPSIYGNPLFAVVDFANTSQWADERLALFDTSGDGIVTVGELKALDGVNSFTGLYTSTTANDTPVSMEDLVEALDDAGNGNGLLEVSEAALIAGSANAVAADVDLDEKIDPLGFEVQTGGEPVYLSMDSPLIRAQGYVDINILSVLTLSGSIAFELGPTKEVILSDGTQKTVSTLSIGGGDISGFVGWQGPYWTDNDRDGDISWALPDGETFDALTTIDGVTYEAGDSTDGITLTNPDGTPIGEFTVNGKTYGEDPSTGDGTVDPTETAELNEDAIGLAITNLDFGLTVMAATALDDLGVYAAGKIRIEEDGFSFVGVEDFLVSGSLNVEFNVGAGFDSGFAPIDFVDSFLGEFDALDTDNDGLLETDDDSLDSSIAAADSNGDNEVTHEELLNYFDSSGDGIITVGVDTIVSSGAALPGSLEALDKDADGIVARGYIVNTGPETDPVIIDFTEFFITVQLGGTIAYTEVFELSGVFLFEADTQGLKIFVDADLDIGPSGDFFDLTATGVLMLGNDGSGFYVAADFSISLEIGNDLSGDVATSSGLALSARLILNTSGDQQSMEIPFEFLNDLSEDAQLRLENANGDGLDGFDGSTPDGVVTQAEIDAAEGTAFFYVISGTVPSLASLFDDQNLSSDPLATSGFYLAIAVSGELQFGGAFDLNGKFAIILTDQVFELHVAASLSIDPLGSIAASGSIRIDSTGIVGRLLLTLDTDFGDSIGLGFTGLALFEINTTGGPVTMTVLAFNDPLNPTEIVTAEATIDDGFVVYIEGTLSFVGFLDADASLLIRYTNGELFLRGTATIEISSLGVSLDIDLNVLISDDGFVLDAAVNINITILEIIRIEASGHLIISIHPNSNAPVTVNVAPPGSPVDNRTYEANTFLLDLFGEVSFLEVITFTAGFKIQIGGGTFVHDSIPDTNAVQPTGADAILDEGEWAVSFGADLDFFGIATIDADGWFNNDAHFALYLNGSLTIGSSSFGIIGTVTVEASNTSAGLTFGGTARAEVRLFGWTLAGLTISFNYNNGLVTITGRIELDFFLFSVDVSKTFTIGLWDIPPPVFLAGSTSDDQLENNDAVDNDGILYLNIGDRAEYRDLDEANLNEPFYVRSVGGTVGDETIEVTAFGRTQSFTGVSHIIADGAEGDDFIIVESGVMSSVDLTGGAGDDVIVVQSAGGTGNRIDGGEGNDYIEVFSSVSVPFTITGGPTSGTGSDNDYIRGGSGGDTINGGFGADIIYGLGGADTINGQDGADTILGGTGIDQLYGNNEADTFIWAPGDGVDSTISGGSGTDELDVTRGSGADSGTVSTTGSSDINLAWIGEATMGATSIESLVIDLGEGADSLVVEDLDGSGITSLTFDMGRTPNGQDSDGNPLFLDGDGDDDRLELYGDETNETFTISSSVEADTNYDLINIERSGRYTATVYGSVWNEADDLVIHGEGGNDSINGSGVTKRLMVMTYNGGSGNDTLVGTPYADTLNSGTGSDTVTGGLGTDVFTDTSTASTDVDTLVETFAADVSLFDNYLIHGHILGDDNGPFFKGNIINEQGREPIDPLFPAPNYDYLEDRGDVYAANFQNGLNTLPVEIEDLTKADGVTPIFTVAFLTGSTDNNLMVVGDFDNEITIDGTPYAVDPWTGTVTLDNFGNGGRGSADGDSFNEYYIINLNNNAGTKVFFGDSGAGFGFTEIYVYGTNDSDSATLLGNRVGADEVGTVIFGDQFDDTLMVQKEVLNESNQWVPVFYELDGNGQRVQKTVDVNGEDKLLYDLTAGNSPETGAVPIYVETTVDTGDPVMVPAPNPDRSEVTFVNTGRLTVNLMGGNDTLTMIDTAAPTVIRLGVGDDTASVGIVPLINDAGNVPITGEFPLGIPIADQENMTNGNSHDVIMYGGTDDDEFEVNTNAAKLYLSGEAGDDTFVINTFLVLTDADTQDIANLATLFGGSGSNRYTYVQNAPVFISGGAGTDTVVINGTPIGDDFIVTATYVVGAGRVVYFTGIERIEINSAGGDDRIFIMSSPADLEVSIRSGTGDDEINLGGDPPPLVFDPPEFSYQPPAYQVQDPPVPVVRTVDLNFGNKTFFFSPFFSNQTLEETILSYLQTQVAFLSTLFPGLRTRAGDIPGSDPLEAYPSLEDVTMEAAASATVEPWYQFLFWGLQSLVTVDIGTIAFEYDSTELPPLRTVVPERVTVDPPPYAFKEPAVFTTSGIEGRISIDAGSDFEDSGGDTIIVHAQDDDGGVSGTLGTFTVPNLEGEEFQIYSKTDSDDIFVSLDPTFTDNTAVRTFSDGASGSFDRTIYSASYAESLGYAPKTVTGLVDVFSFTLTSSDLTSLTNEGVASSVVTALGGLQDTTYNSESEFLTGLLGVISQTDLDTYQALILSVAADLQVDASGNPVQESGDVGVFDIFYIQVPDGEGLLSRTFSSLQDLGLGSGRALDGTIFNGVEYDEAENMTIILGEGNDTFNVNTTNGTLVTLSLGGGSDEVNVRKMDSEVRVLGGAGADTVNVNNGANRLEDILALLTFEGDAYLEETVTDVLYDPTIEVPGQPGSSLHDEVLDSDIRVYINTNPDDTSGAYPIYTYIDSGGNETKYTREELVPLVFITNPPRDTTDPLVIRQVVLDSNGFLIEDLVQNTDDNGVPLWRDTFGKLVSWDPTDWANFPTQLLDYSNAYLATLQSDIENLQDAFGFAVLDSFDALVKAEILKRIAPSLIPVTRVDAVGTNLTESNIVESKATDGAIDTLNVTDTGNSTGNAGAMTSSTISGIFGTNGSLEYNDLEIVNILLGSGVDLFDIESTHGAATGTYLEQTNVSTGADADIVNIDDVSDTLVVNGEADGDTVNVFGTSASSNTTINGDGGLDTINVRAMEGPVAVNGGSGIDTVNVGSSSPLLPGVPTNQVGTLDDINDLLTVDGGGQLNDTLNVDDSNPADTGMSGTLTNSAIRGLEFAAGEGIDYTNFDKLNIWLASGNNTFHINSTHSGETTVSTAGGNDTININDASGMLTVNGEAGNDIFNVRKTSLNSVAYLFGNGGTDTFNLSDNSPALPAPYPSGLNPPSADREGLIDQIDGLVDIDGGSEGDVLNIDDSANILDKAATLTSTTLRGLLLPAGVNYLALEDLNLWLGSGKDVLFIDSTHTGTTQVYAGDGNETTNERDDTIGINSISGITTIHGQRGNDFIEVNVGAYVLPQNTVFLSSSPISGLFYRTDLNRLDAVLNLHGEGNSDRYTVNLANDGNALINVHDNGAFNDGVDTLVINGADTIDHEGNEIIGNNPDDTFLLRRDFVALLNDSDDADQAFDQVERVNYDENINARLIVNGLGGHDAFAADDNSSTTTLDGGEGDDEFQIGQVFGTPRDIAANISGEDQFDTTPIIIGAITDPNPASATFGLVIFDPVKDTLNPEKVAEITDAVDYAVSQGEALDGIAYVSDGVTHPTTVFGGNGEDEISVYHNKGTLRLEGEGGDDTFIVRAFVVLDGSVQGDTEVSGGQGDDEIQYAINAPVSIDGGAGFDVVLVIGTPFSDHFVITSNGIFGAGLNVRYENVESAELDTLEGDDTIFVLGTDSDMLTTVIGGRGNDVISVMGDVTEEIISNDLLGRAGLITHDFTEGESDYVNAGINGVAPNIISADSGAFISISPFGDPLRVSENGLVAQYFITLTGPLPSGLTEIYLTVSAGIASTTDQDLGGASLRVSADNSTFTDAIVLTLDTPGVAIPVWVEAIDDGGEEGERLALVSHTINSGLFGEDDAYDSLAMVDMPVIIVDNDVTALDIRQFDGILSDNTTQVLENGFTDIYTFQLVKEPAPGEIVTVNLDYDPAQLTLTQDSFTFGPGFLDWDEVISVTVSAFDDSQQDGNEISAISHKIVVDGTVVHEQELEVIVYDNESAGLVVRETGGSTIVVENGADDQYHLRMTRLPDGEQTLTLITDGQTFLSSTDPRLSVVLSESTDTNIVYELTFNEDNWDEWFTVIVSANPDYEESSKTVKTFVPGHQDLQSISGPLVLNGGFLSGENRSLNEAVILPGELNDQPLEVVVNTDESEDIDILNIFHTDNTDPDTGTLFNRVTDATDPLFPTNGIALTGFEMGDDTPLVTIQDSVEISYDRGLTMSNFEIVEILLGKGNESLDISETLDGAITAVHGGGGDDNVTITGRGNGPLVVYGDTSEDGVRYSNSTGKASVNGTSFSDSGSDTIDASRLADPQDEFVGIVIYGGPGADTIKGSQGNDHLAGGAGADTIHGEAGNDHIYGDSHFNVDLLLFAQDRVNPFDASEPAELQKINDMFTIPTTGTGDGDTINGNEGNDTIFGDHGVIDQLDGTRRLFTTGSMVALQTVNLANGGTDTIHGNAGNDFIFGGTDSDTIYGDAGSDLVFGDFGTVSGDVDPTLIGAVDGAGVTNPNAAFLYVSDTSLEADQNAGGDIIHGGSLTLLDVDTGKNILLGQQGADTIYGGGSDDNIYGGHNVANGTDTGDFIDAGAGNDVILGDNGLIEWTSAAEDPRFAVLTGTILYDIYGVDQVAPGAATNPVGVEARKIILFDHDDSANNTGNYGNDTIAGGADDDVIFGQLGNDALHGDGKLVDDNGTLVLASLLGTITNSDVGGDDYVEGNGGNDTIFGGLGQDDLIGGSSTHYNLDIRTDRPDGSDTIYGGNGDMASRNNYGAATDESGNSIVPVGDLNARDSDMIIGDNGNIFRIVGTNGTDSSSFLEFNYDTYSATRSIVVRVAQLLDYTPGGSDIDPVSAALDMGAADEIHGESGDDFIYGMLGNDVLFGDAQNDDLIGGTGADWISGGTHDDGILGDDGRLWSSRNGTAEPLYGIEAITDLDLVISTPGKIQEATINVTGQLKKTAILEPFNLGEDDYITPGNVPSNDILFGGLGNDAIHGGAGDDAISGTEALPQYFSNPVNPGNYLGYGLERAGEFNAYDEYNPMTKVFIDPITGIFTDSTTPGAVEFILNFIDSEIDGNDVLFGDLGNDWIVGAQGRDHAYGGWGDDLINMDDIHDTSNGLNDVPDPGNINFEDIAYGGAGRDILIANTGGDRLIDWAGEFNSYLVPFAPFGMGTVSRALQPQIAEYLYDLSESDGADYTRPAKLGISAEEARNGEPFGELGVVLQQDFAWQDQTGAPDDPQPGNIGGGKRDVLRSVGFNNGQPDGFFIDSGNWTTQSGSYYVEPETLGGDALSVFLVDSYIPTYFEVKATLQPVKPTGGFKSNAYLVFDYQSSTDFKFAGINVSTSKLEIGRYTANGWTVDVQAPYPGALKSDTLYNVFLAVNGTSVTLMVDNKVSLTHEFEKIYDEYGILRGLNDGMIGLGGQNSRSAIDNVVVQRIAPETTFTLGDDFDGAVNNLFLTPTSGAWSAGSGLYRGNANTETAISLIGIEVAPASLIRLEADLQASGQAGYVFDYYDADNYKFVTLSSETNEVIIGHSTRKGIVIDETYTSLNHDLGESYNLEVILKGNTVSVTLNGGLILSYAFNALVTDGDYGLIAFSGVTDFNEVTFQTDDPALAPEDGVDPNPIVLVPVLVLPDIEDDVSVIEPETEIVESINNPDSTSELELSGGLHNSLIAPLGSDSLAWVYIHARPLAKDLALQLNSPSEPLSEPAGSDLIAPVESDESSSDASPVWPVIQNLDPAVEWGTGTAFSELEQEDLIRFSSDPVLYPEEEPLADYFARILSLY